MACRRFAELCARGAPVRLTRTIAIAIGAIAAAASLAGCATAPPLSLEEQVWFDKATGTDISGVPPGLRMERVGYQPFVVPGPPPPPPY
jgi:hypothetical protein